MRRIILSVAACALGLVLTGTASASPSPRGHGHGYVRHGYHGHGVRFSGGYYYTARAHPVWGRRVWDAHYRRYQYFDTYRNCWYYWAAVQQCYYPVGYVCP